MKRTSRLRADPSKTRDWQRRSRKPLAATGTKAARDAPAVAAFRAALRRRSGGWCEVDTPACSPGLHAAAHAHHVWPSDRDRGTHDPGRGLFVCAAGHSWIHAEPAAAETRGWLRRSGDAG